MGGGSGEWSGGRESRVEWGEWSGGRECSGVEWGEGGESGVGGEWSGGREWSGVEWGEGGESGVGGGSGVE